MGNKFTRIDRRTVKKKKKKPSKKDRHIFKAPEGQYRIFPDAANAPVCMKCASGFMQEVRTTGKHQVCRGHLGIMESSPLTICGAQFDAKKFDKTFKLNAQQYRQTKTELEDESESENDSFVLEEAERLTDSSLSEKSEFSETYIQPEDDDDNNSYHSIFEVFKKLEYDALLNETALDEMFFYPAIKECTEYGESTIKYEDEAYEITPHFIVTKASTHIIDDERRINETNQINQITEYDGPHLYDTIDRCGNLSVQALEVPVNIFHNDFKKDEVKVHNRNQNQIVKSADMTLSDINFDLLQHKPNPFNTTQFDARQIDATNYDGVLFNDSEFDAKLFNATPSDFIQFFFTQIKRSTQTTTFSQFNSTQKIDNFNSFNEFQVGLDTSQDKSNVAKLNKKPKQSLIHSPNDDTKLTIPELNSSNVTDFEAAFLRTAQFVASHFGNERSSDIQIDAESTIAAPFRSSQFITSQFDAKQFDVSQFSVTQFDSRQFDARQFTASQFDAKAFEARNFSHSRKKCFEPLRFGRYQQIHNRSFNVTQVKFFNATQFQAQQVYAM